ncbi:MAG: YggS family pyridoxal phosphate-dependent enzyme [Candidatus Nanopelagicales bacterium]|nr:YggS family pyridoxal phosphate-dependent enzyme [Candidatus Nanopelagicales bacterium]
MSQDRKTQLAGNLAAVHARIDRACADAGRDRAGVRLVVVTKTFPASDVKLLAALGVRDVGENRDQEAKAKKAACEQLPLRWHLIGQLQRNKVNSVLQWADVVQTVDRPELAAALDGAAGRLGRRLSVMLQVALDSPIQSARGGCAPAAASALAEYVLSLSHLDLCGVMGVAPIIGDPAAAFSRLVQAADAVRGLVPGADQISAGMSGDLEAAIAHGATQVRLGGAVLGNRPALP